jgi:hypothetical protein
LQTGGTIGAIYLLPAPQLASQTGGSAVETIKRESGLVLQDAVNEIGQHNANKKSPKPMSTNQITKIDRNKFSRFG